MQAMHQKSCAYKKAKVDESPTMHSPHLALKVPHLFSDHLAMNTADAILYLSRIWLLNLIILKINIETFQVFSSVKKIIYIEDENQDFFHEKVVL